MSPATRPGTASVVPAPPPAATVVFGDRLPLAVRYAELLSNTGVERGLIGPREAARVWSRHLLNSAALAELVPAGARVVDVGSGAGLPGIPLLLARPVLAVTLVEPMLRRVTFLEEVRADLDLPVSIVRARATVAGIAGTQSPGTQIPGAGGFDVAVARAVAPLDRLVELAAPLLAPGGLLLALKGRGVHGEIQEAGPVIAAHGGEVTVAEVGADDWSTSVACVTLTRPGGDREAAPRRRSTGR